MNLVPSFTLYADSRSNVPPRFIHIETISVRSRVNDWIIRPHRHPELFQILLLTRGGAEMRLESNTARLDAPTLTAIVPNAVHGYAFQTDAEGFVLSVSDAYLRDLLRATGDQEATDAAASSSIIPLADWGDVAENIRAACERIAAESQSLRTGSQARSGGDLMLIFGLLAELGPEGRGSASTERGADAILFDRFRLLVEERFRDQLSIKDYAAALATSERTLRRTVKARSGQSPLDILRQRILLEAQRDLLYSAMSVSEIAYGLGFEDQAYFSRFFAGATGQSPSRFRATHKSGWTGTVTD
ncbi:MAG: helix-turn-helix domain-containing protein [Nisaea sp.]|uniref:helix-turn-helix domain-containing protein n=1 Tax=Nisaea sp. TaxID=2024842 RepID=UPI001B132662|nr:helix-turn-helix domain-containing protein [Nisaea sp.]MBO6559575.1 helix-turn-helix domain-containing protein [Nisaea sp.]